VFVANHRSGRRCVLSAVVSLRPPATSPGFASKFVAHGSSCANFRSFWSISDSEGPDGPETGTADAGATRLDLAGSSICNGIFLRRVEGPGTPGETSYIGN